MGMTLVTFLFDLARREPETGRRTVSTYLERAEDFLFGIDRDLVVFAEPELAEPIEERRRRRGLGGRTRVFPVAFEELPTSALVSQIAAARRERPLLNGDPRKDTPLYTALICAKPELAARVAQSDPFGGSHVGWIDFGILARPYPGEDPFAHPAERVRLLSMRPLFGHELTPKEGYFSALYGHIAANYACGSRQNIAWLGAAFARLVRETLDAGYAGSEEQLLPILAHAYPERFEFHHGDYSEALTNYLAPHGGAENLSYQLRRWRDEGVPGEGATLAQAICESVEAGEFDADPESLAILLDDCYVAAWYAENEPRPLARRIADLYLGGAERDEAFRDAFLRYEIHVRRNFSFLESARR
jgi:hypothetical protein